MLFPIGALIVLCSKSIRKAELPFVVKVSMTINSITGSIAMWVIRTITIVKVFFKNLFVVIVVLLLSLTGCKQKEFVIISNQNKDSVQLAIASETKEKVNQMLVRVQEIKTSVKELANREETTTVIERDTVGRIIKETNNIIKLVTSTDTNISDSVGESYLTILDRVNDLSVQLMELRESLNTEEQEVVKPNVKGTIALIVGIVIIIGIIAFGIYIRKLFKPF